jgi:predicted Zn-ribbon and HTH transcriptional regulator
LSQAICIHGYAQQFKSKTDAIIFLLEEKKLEIKQILQKMNCTHQHLSVARKKMEKLQKDSKCPDCGFTNRETLRHNNPNWCKTCGTF